MTDTDAITDFIAPDCDLTKSQIRAVLAALPAAIVQRLRDDSDAVRITNLGTFRVIDTPARRGRNPATGEAIDIPAGRRIKFTAAKALKESL